ncbi:MAG: hypothetical protein ACOYMN_09935, partial [Roseimicrobium sp.]
MNPRSLIFSVLCALCGWTSVHAQSLRFFGRPAEVYEGDAVVFTYRTDLASYHGTPGGIVPLGEILSWKWDFNGDVIDVNDPNDPGWDEAKTVGEVDGFTGIVTKASDISTTWYATYDQTRANGGIQTIRPKLLVTYDSGSGPVTIARDGVTENMIGPAGVAPDPDRDISVKDRSVGNADVSVNFTVNPRLANAAQTGPPAVPTDTVRLYSNVKPADNRTLVSATYAWTITNTGGGTPITSTQANPQLTNLTPGSYDVSLAANYTVSYVNAQGTTVTVNSDPAHPLTETKKDAFRVVAVLSSLQKGRAYRIGFPETFG